LGIPFVVFQYLGASTPQEEIDLALIEFQFKHLMEHGEWLSHEKMKNLMSRGL
jgi:hypothetical protein